jgi:hypothetical protein
MASYYDRAWCDGMALYLGKTSALDDVNQNLDWKLDLPDCLRLYYKQGRKKYHPVPASNPRLLFCPVV